MWVPLFLLLVTIASAADHKRLLLHNDVDVAAAFASLQQNMTDFGNQVKQLESKIGQLESTNNLQETKLGQLEGENHQLKTNVSQLESTNNLQETKLGQLEGENHQLKTNVSQLESTNSLQETRIGQLEGENNQLKTNVSQQDDELAQLTTQNQQLQSRVNQLQTATQQNGNSGSVYVRWGRNVCPGNGSELIYKGIIGGTLHSSKGGGSNSLCLPEDPTWNKYLGGDQGSKSAIYGTEIEDHTHFSTTAFGYDYNFQDPPCVTCLTSRASVVMIPGRQNCYPGWTREYTGYIVAGRADHASSDYICLDSRPGELPHGLDSNSNNQHILYFVEAKCGSLPCPPYHDGREIACVVCSK